MSIRDQGTGISEVEETDDSGKHPVVFVEYYTDPLCSWSWAFEMYWRRLRYECAGRLDLRYHMGGLIPNWQSYDDPFNDIRNPAQMGPQWFQVAGMTGMPLDERLWQIDPPASSYPACIAVNAAAKQGQLAVENYLRRLREAAMLERRNIATQDVLLAIAEETAQEQANSLDIDRFRDDLASPATMETFRQDLRDAAFYNIGRFPTLILKKSDGHGIVLVGFRPYDVLCAALDYLEPGLRQPSELSREELATDYVNFWNRVLARELNELLGEDIKHTIALLEALATKGAIKHADATQSATPIYIPA
jgi:putative protein-disulfide isomerase